MAESSEPETIQSTAEGFHPLSYFVKHLERYPWVVQLMKEDPSFLRATTKILSDLGFRRFRFLGSGFYSLVLETTENQLVRIARKDFGDYGKRPHHPAVLQPILHTEFSHGFLMDRETLLVDVFPKVRTDGVTQEQAIMVADALEKSGFITEDRYARDMVGRIQHDDAGNPIYNTSNIGLIDVDGKTIPVLIDAGLIKRTKRTAKDDSHLKPWLDSDGTWLQHKFESRTAPTNLIDRSSLENTDLTLRGPKPFLTRIGFKKDPRPSSQTVEAITKDGLYKSELAELYARAVKRLDGSEMNFSELLMQERERMRNERGIHHE